MGGNSHDITKNMSQEPTPASFCHKVATNLPERGELCHMLNKKEH